MTIAITGATGQLGALVIQELKLKIPTKNILALVRNPEKLADQEITAKVFDYSKPETFNDALAEVDTLVLISSSEIGKRIEQHANVISAAKKANVKRVIYTSLLHADTSVIGFAEEHLATEANIKTSGLSYTILRNGWYTENYTGSVGSALANDALVGSAGDGRISSATRQDFAEAIVAVVTNEEGHENVTHELPGDEAWTLSDLANEISKQAGKNIPYHDLPPSEYSALLESIGISKELAEAIVSWDVSASKGALYGEERTLSKLIGRPTTSLATSVEQALREV